MLQTSLDPFKKEKDMERGGHSAEFRELGTPLPTTETPGRKEKNVHSAAFGWNVSYISAGSIWPIVFFQSAVSSLIFCLDDLSIVESGILKP